MLIIGISGYILTTEEKIFLQHPAVAGVILFSRNYANIEQLRQLCQSIRDAVEHPILLCVDQEGGRVQRFRDDFTKLPSLEILGAMYMRDAASALALAHAHAYVMASEVMAAGLDVSFAPVADLGRGNLAIGNRAFSAQPETTAHFIAAYVDGMRQAGMAACLKHFPGHGSVLEDTHFDDACDERSFEDIEAMDLVPFKAGLQAGADAVMMAHVRYPHVADEPAGYSSVWINQVLKIQLQFNGLVISDDIGMAAAESVGGVGRRIALHLDAGCDVVLVCPPALVAAALESLPEASYNYAKLDRLRVKPRGPWQNLLQDQDYQSALDAINKLGQV
jgi:beta-N-acetylhexosaminidase